MHTGLEIDSVLKSFGERTILADVYLKCCRGDIIALFGRNGTRKFIRIDGKVINGPAFRSGLLAYLPQHPSFPSHLKVSQIAELCIAPEDRKRFLADKMLLRLRTSRICEISTGEQRYLEIKTTLFSPAPYILLDEPFSGVSPIVAEQLRILMTESAKNHGIILTDHNFREVHKIANRLTLLNECYLKEIKQVEELIPYGYYQP